MSNLENFGYEDFGRLRFLDYFPKNTAYVEDGFAGVDYGTGYAGMEGYRATLFARQHGQTTAIVLDFAEDCPEREGRSFLYSLGLKLEKGMTHAQTLAALGVPETDSPNFVRFVVGKRWQYLICCNIDISNGLFRILIARKDLVDELDAM